jgi:thiol-disulfide isomerase/thioredoxin
MRRELPLLMILIAVVSATSPTAVGRADSSNDDRVVACYFHRTERCPTCRKISRFIEGAVRERFADETKSGSVGVTMIDYQAEENQRLAEDYEITGPTLIIMEIVDGEVKRYKRAPKVWALVGNQEKFFDYIEKEIRGYREAE